MALSAKTIGAIAEELSEKLTGGRIEKIQQPEKDLILITVRAEGISHKLLIRASGPYARAHLTKQSFENPPAAPNFCMLLRKYLNGARLNSVTQPNGDRLLAFSFESRNELGDRADLKLMVELMGRAANIILTDSEGRIVDCLRRIPLSEYGCRALLPGLRYELPERPAEFVSERKSTEYSRETETETPLQAEAGISEMLDLRYGDAERQELQRRRAQELVKTVRRMRDRQQRKLVLQREELRRTDQLKDIRRQAELLQANLYRVHRGDRVLECEDYYAEACPPVIIELDPVKTPQENLAAKFKHYRKMKGAKDHLTTLIADGQNQLDYLNSVLDEISRAQNEKDLLEIRTEIESTGLLRAQKKKKAKAGKPSAPLQFESPDGLGILVGRNNSQNDELTTHLARRTDYWFHVQKLHGSHVILCCEGSVPSERALQSAAELAAHYSQANGSGKVAVDYTMVRNVRKPAGALPGKVTYTNYQTMIVDSRETPAEGERR